MIEELRLRDEMMAKERREWKVEREDLLEETVHLKAQVRHCCRDYLNLKETARFVLRRAAKRIRF